MLKQTIQTLAQDSAKGATLNNNAGGAGTIPPTESNAAMAVSTLLIKSNQASQLEAKTFDDPISPEVHVPQIYGYASVWDEVDLDGDIIRRGTFAKSIQERVAAGKVLLMSKHMAYGGDTGEAVGIVREAEEDHLGLKFRADLYPTAAACDLHAKVNMTPNAFGASVGFKPVKSTPLGAKVGQGKRQPMEFTEAILWEITVTALPANVLTSVRAKSEANIIQQLEQRVAALEAKAQTTTETTDATAPSTDHSAGQNAADTGEQATAKSVAFVPQSETLSLRLKLLMAQE